MRLSLRRRSTFLSTPSGWRATGLVVLIPAHAVDFYPRPPGGGRPPLFSHSPCNTPISIHALRVEGDCYPSSTRDCRDLFLSTPSGWRATRPRQLLQPEAKFLSTPSGWRATGKRDNIRPARQICLSTPSGWRATTGPYSSTLAPTDFYPRPPGGGRLRGDGFVLEQGYNISIHALRVEGDHA